MARSEVQHRRRPRLSRTFARARWDEYHDFLITAIENGYELLPLEQWVDRGFETSGRTLVLRHDVDQHPAAALRMLGIEQELGLQATWYFRWRTAHATVVERVRASGSSVGLHYETLTRLALRRGLAGSAADSLLDSAREELCAEFASFARRFGPTRSACPHGDSRIPSVRNADLLRGQNLTPYEIEFDGNEVIRGHRLGHWLTDRSSAEGGWAGRVSATDLLHDGVTPILCVAHPNNWASGPDLWADRIASATLPDPKTSRPRRPIRTGSDTPLNG